MALSNFSVGNSAVRPILRRLALGLLILLHLSWASAAQDLCRGIDLIWSYSSPGTTPENKAETPEELCEILDITVLPLIDSYPSRWHNEAVLGKKIPTDYVCVYRRNDGSPKEFGIALYYRRLPSTVWNKGYPGDFEDCGCLNGCCGGAAGGAMTGTPYPDSMGAIGNPILTATGEKIEDTLDWRSARDPRFAFSRHYSSSETYDQSIAMVGYGMAWWSPWERRIYQVNNKTFYLHTERNNRLGFASTTNSSPITTMSGDTPLSMTREASGDASRLIVTDGSGKKEFYTRTPTTGSTVALLQEVLWPDGYRISISRDASNRISAMADNKGQRAQFAWQTRTLNNPVIIEIPTVTQIQVDTDYTGAGFDPEVTIDYVFVEAIQVSSNVLLSSVNVANADSGQPISEAAYQYDVPTSLATGSLPTMPAKLIEILDGRTDAAGQPFPYSNFQYAPALEGLGLMRAIRTGRTDFTADTYDVTQLPMSQVSVVNPLGKEAIVTTATAANRPVVTVVDGIPTSSCLATTASLGYTPNAGAPEGFVYERVGRNGSVTRYTRDSRGLPLTVTEDAGGPVQRVTTYTWHPTLRLPLTRTTAEMNETFTYSPEGLVTSYSQQDILAGSPSQGETRTWTYGYTPLASSLQVMTSLDGPGLAAEGVNDVTTYTYTPLGELATVTDPNGLVTTVLSRNAQGQATVVEEPNGNRWSFTYDPMGRVLTAGVAGPGEAPLLRSFTYDIAGLITGYTDTRGAAWAFTYDEARRLTKTVAPMNDITTYGYDAAGNVTLTEVRRGSGAVTFKEQNEFDELGRLLRSIGAMGQQWTFAHDVEDNLSKVTDPLNKFDSFGYDALNRLIDVVDRRAAEVTMDWDPGDRMTSYTDQRAIETTYAYNGFGDLISEISPDRGRTDYGYDDRGLVILRTDGRNVTTLYGYDNGGRPVLIDYPAGGLPDVTLSYDQAKLGVPADANKGYLSQVTDGTIKMEFGHQMTAAYERIRTKTTLPGGRSYLVLEDVDFEGDSPRIVLPSGTEVNYTRNAAGKVSRVRVKIGGVWNDIATSITYAPDGPLTGMTYGDGIPQTRTYDLSYRLTALADGNAGTTLRQTGYGYDSRDNITSITDGLVPANNETYGYTFREELKTATGAYGALSWVYNDVGSRWAETRSSLTDNYTYPAANNRLSSIALGAGGSRSFTYDGAGNTVTDSRAGGTVYAYDSAGRLASVTTGGVLQATYRYDVLGRQVLRTLVPSGVTIQSIFDSQGRRVAEYDQGTGALIREYVWLDWEPLAVIEGGAIFYVRADHIGRPVFATNASGTKVWTMGFDPFGTLIASSGNPIAARFPGQWFQAESGLHQNWMRDYDPTTGRYIQPDPLGLIDGSSVYGYAGQNPGRWTDPRGTETTVLISTPRGVGVGHVSLILPDTIYDPSGNCSCQFEDDGYGPVPPGSGDTYFRNPSTDRAFFGYQFSNPDEFLTQAYLFPTTPTEEALIRKRIDDRGGGGIMGCSISVSSVLSGIGPFKNLEPTNWPSRLRNRIISIGGVEYVRP